MGLFSRFYNRIAGWFVEQKPPPQHVNAIQMCLKYRIFLPVLYYLGDLRLKAVQYLRLDYDNDDCVLH